MKRTTRTNNTADDVEVHMLLSTEFMRVLLTAVEAVEMVQRWR